MKRNETCSCGSGKKFKNCCKNTNSSFSNTKRMYKYFLFIVIACIAITASWSIFNKQTVEIPEGHVWCSNCARYHAPDQK